MRDPATPASGAVKSSLLWAANPGKIAVVLPSRATIDDYYDEKVSKQQRNTATYPTELNMAMWHRWEILSGMTGMTMKKHDLEAISVDEEDSEMVDDVSRNVPLELRSFRKNSGEGVKRP